MSEKELNKLDKDFINELFNINEKEMSISEIMENTRDFFRKNGEISYNEFKEFCESIGYVEKQREKSFSLESKVL